MASLLDKKISDLTAEEVQSLARPIGIEGMPYPMVLYRALQSDKKDAKGKVVAKESEMVQEIGIIDSVAKSMVLYSEMDMQRVQGELFRKMPIPSMLLMLRDLLAKQAPTSTNRIFTVFGDPAFGKSFLFKTVAGLIHPQGAIQVDCGGMNMREIFFRTVIDYGAGVQELLEKRLAEGKVSRDTVDYLNSEFPDAVVSKNGKSVIDWERIGARRTEDDGAGKQKAVEDRGAAMERASRVMRLVYEKEKISHLSNAFGIKTVPGEFFEALWSGRPLFLDEFNKSKRGTLDSWQTALQFLNGEESSVTIYNPMSQSSGDDAMKAITVRREDIKPAFIVGVAGNEGKDGDTTQELSESMMTRLNPMYVGNPTLRDWEHRISQVWTGLPLVTLYHIFQDFATAKPAEFAEYLVDLRKMGLTPREVAAIPNKELYLLQNWQDTVTAVKQVAAQQDFRYQLANTSSALFEKKEFTSLGDEINSDARARQIGVSFRKVIADHNKAMEGMPEAHVPGKGLMPDIRGAFAGLDASALASRTPGWHRFGANLANAMIEDIINVTKDMPQTRAALLKECEAHGILQPTFKEARASESVKPLSELLKYDELRDIGGTEELKATQRVIMMALRAMNPGIKSADNQVVPLENLGRALQSFRDAKGAEGRVIVPNDDLNQVKAQPLLAVEAVASYNLKSSGARHAESVDFRALLAAMALPDYAQKNREQVWLDDLLDMPLVKESLKGKGTAEAAVLTETYQTLTGHSKSGFHLSIASAQDEAGKPVYLYVIEDKVRSQTLIVGPQGIPPQLDSALKNNGVTYLVKSDAATATIINEFLKEGAVKRHESGTMAKDDSYKITNSLIYAFGCISELPQSRLKYDKKGEPVIKENSTVGSVITEATGSPEIFKKFVKAARPKA